MKSTQIGPRCQSKECTLHPVVFRHLSCVSDTFEPRLELDWLLPTSRVGEYWREGRRLLDRSLGPGSTTAYRRMMEDNTHLFLGQLLETPEDFFGHIQLSVLCIDLCF